MSDFSLLQKRQNQTLLLVCVNFVLFMILFLGLGYVTWQSALLVNRLKTNLDKAEQTIVQLQNKIQNMDTDQLINRLVDTATQQLGESIRSVVQQTDLTTPIALASEKIAATQELVKQTGEAVQQIQQTVARLDNEAIAQQVSYQILKGLGDGFQQAAESRKPEPASN